MSLNLTCEAVARVVWGEPIKREGAELLYRCPHAERHKNWDADPSLKINPKKDVWGDFACGAKGKGSWSLAAFIAGIDPGDKKGVSAWLTEHGLRGRGVFTPPDTAATLQHSEGLTLEQYAAAKKLPVEFLRSLGLSTVYLSKQPAVRIVYIGADGFEKAVRFRLEMEKGADDGRFRWKRGSKPLLYGLECIRDAQAQAYCCLVEGESDRQTLCYHGIPALGLPGAGIWREEWAERLGEIPVIYVFVEGDQGGETVLKWLANSKIRERARLVRLRTAKDASALYLANPQTSLAPGRKPWRRRCLGGSWRDSKRRKHRGKRGRFAEVSHHATTSWDACLR